jgi:hypothetical protein
MLHKTVAPFKWNELPFIKFRPLNLRKALNYGLISKVNYQVNYITHEEVYPNVFTKGIDVSSFDGNGLRR